MADMCKMAGLGLPKRCSRGGVRANLEEGPWAAEAGKRAALLDAQCGQWGETLDVLQAALQQSRREMARAIERAGSQSE